MRKWLLLALGLLAARSPAPTDPVAVYVDGVQNLATENAATVELTHDGRASSTARTGESFWVDVVVDVGGGGKVLSLSGNLFYDSLLVRPTGLLDNPAEESIVGSLTDGTRLAGECVSAGTNRAAISRISWKAPAGFELEKLKLRFQFLPISAGTATFSWTDAFVDCEEATIADGDYDRKPSGIIWWKNDAYYTAIPSDGGSYASSDLTVVIEGATKNKGSFWASNPESLEVYVDLGPTIQASAGDTVSVPLGIWYPSKIGAGDSIGVTVVWEATELWGVSATAVDGWRISSIDPIDWISFGRLFEVGSLTTLCGIDSAAAAIFWLSADGGDRTASGTVATIVFEVVRDGNATVSLGCWMPAIAGLIDPGSWPPFAAETVYQSGDRRYLMQRETKQQSWRWRFGSRGTVVVQ